MTLDALEKVEPGVLFFAAFLIFWFLLTLWNFG